MIINLLDLFVKIAVNDEASDKVKTIAGNIGNGLKTAAKIGTAAVGAAAAGITALTTASINSYAEYEQLAGGAAKIFDEISQATILTDAANAYKNLGLTASQYLSVMNDVGATFAATMGDEAGYDTAKTGLKAISDYASGTGKNINELSQKFTLITRSTSSYQSIADQFSGVLPATSAAFLEQAQAAGILSDSYTQLTEVPISEYQAAVSQMLQQGVSDLGLANNTAAEAYTTITGSFTMMKSAWSNLITGMADENADLPALVDNVVESALAFGENLLPRVEVVLQGATKLIEGLFPQIVEMLPGLIETTLPSILNGALLIIETLVSSLDQNKESIIPAAFALIMTFASSILDLLPDILRIGMDLLIEVARGISSALPELLPVLVEVIREIATILTNVDSVRELTGAALDIIVALAEGLGTAIPELVDVIIMIVDNIVTMLLDPENTAKLINAALRIIIAIGGGLIAATPELLLSVKSLIDSVIENFKTTDWGETGRTIIDGLLDGIKAAWGNITEWFSNAWSGLGDLFSGWFGGDGDDKKTGSHAGGLSYVPRSGDLYELHQGEMVLTADEARRYRQDRNNIGYVQQSNTPVNVVMQVDKTTLGRLVFDLNNNQEYINGYNIAEVPG